MSQNERKERLMPNNIPRWIRCYDDRGKTIDRYTVVFTNVGKTDHAARGYCYYVGMSGSPFHPQGFCQHGEHTTMIDRPRSSHLGKRITFLELPSDCQQVVLSDYKEIWSIT